MRKYAEVHQGFVIGFHERDDMRRPEFVGSIAVRIDMLNPQPSIGDEWDGRQFKAPTRPNPNLAPPPLTNRQLLERILELLEP